MQWRALDLDCRDSILWVRLASPHCTLGARLIGELRDLLLAEREATSCRVVVLTGTGDRFFSPGFDLNEVVEADRRSMAALMRQFIGVLLQLRVYPKPTIALLNGHALAGGCLLASACDFRMARPEIRIGMTELTRDVLIPYESLRILREVLGNQKAREVALLGSQFEALKALGVGWVDEVVDGEHLGEAVERLAGQLAETKPAVIRHLKQGLRDEHFSGEISDSHLEFFLDCWFAREAQERIRKTRRSLGG